MEKKIKFEAALERLNVITERLEAGDATLDESLSLYEEGIALVRLCTERLEAAEQRIKKIRTEGGNTEEAEWVPGK